MADPASHSAGPTSLANLVDPRGNALNTVRLALAASVVLWHNYPLNGHAWTQEWTRPFLAELGVDGFFAISGYLLAGSWLHSPRLLPYLRNRALRIMPAFWACLVIVAFIFAPLSLWLTDQDPRSAFSGDHSAFAYIFGNAGLTINVKDVTGTPSGGPFPGVWNGSLWTLRWEAGAYIALVAIGLLGILRKRWLVLTLAGGVWALMVAELAGIAPDNYWVVNFARLGFMFLAGSTIQVWADRLPAAGWAPIVAVGLIGVAPVLDDYRIIGGFPLAFLVIWLGGRITHPTLQLKDRDISYGLYIYAFPVQQTLVLLGSPTWHPAWSALATLAFVIPLAAASWVLIERPALKLKNWSRLRPQTASVAASRSTDT